MPTKLYFVLQVQQNFLNKTQIRFGTVIQWHHTSQESFVVLHQLHFCKITSKLHKMSHPKTAHGSRVQGGQYFVTSGPVTIDHHKDGYRGSQINFEHSSFFTHRPFILNNFMMKNSLLKD